MRKRVLALFIVMLFVFPTTLSFVTNPGGSNLQNVTELVKEPVLSYEEKETKHLACDGSLDSDLYIDGDYWDTWVDDASYISAYPINYTGIHLIFNITESRPFEELNFFLRWQVTIDNPGDQPMPVYWMLYNFDTFSYDTIYSDLPGSSFSWEDREESITFDENYVNSTNHLRFYAYGSTVYVDEIEIDYAYLTVTKRYDGEFRETLPDDVLYYPDPLEHTACDGSLDSDPFITGDWWDTWADDASYLTADSSYYVGISLIFNITEYANFLTDNATLNFFLRWQVPLSIGDDPTMYWKIYNFDTSAYDTVYSVVLSTTLDFENREESIIYDEKYVNATNHVRFYVSSSNQYADDITVDYAYLTATNGYTESFADVSDWSVWSPATISTDGDVMSLEFPDTDDWGQAYMNDISLTVDLGYYMEISYRANTTIDAGYVMAYSGDTGTGTALCVLATGYISDTSWQILKGPVTIAGTIESIKLSLADNLNATFFLDYIRIGPANEMGWQHDGSTISGVEDDSDPDFIYEISSDGDILTINTTLNASTGNQWGDSYVKYDSSSISADMELDYYQFIKVRWRCTAFSADNVYVYGYIDSLRGLVSEYKNSTFDWEVIYVNAYSYSLSTTTKAIAFITKGDTAGENTIIEIDYMKVYSIANYTVTESSTTTDDFLYVDAGVLNSNMDNGSFILEYVPTFLLTGSYTWTKTTTTGESYLSYLHGGWTDYSNETTGDLYAGTTTGLRIKFNETANIQTIEYSVRQAQWILISTAIINFDMPNWWVIATAEAVFYIPFGEFTIQFMLMIMGLVMIPFSTLFLVIGGREEMSKDKFYFFLLMFLIGWALVLGGIL